MNEAEKMDEILRLLKSGSPVRLTPEQCAMVLEGISQGSDAEPTREWLLKRGQWLSEAVDRQSLHIKNLERDNDQLYRSQANDNVARGVLAQERDCWKAKAEASETYAIHATKALQQVETVMMIVMPRSHTREYLETLDLVRAALAKNPNPSGQTTAEASEAASEPSLQAEASGPVGLGPQALAMRVMQSDLYGQLDDAERAECDAMLDRHKAWLRAGMPDRVNAVGAAPITNPPTYQDGLHAAWTAIDKLIVTGELPYHEHEQRNGVVLACNAVAALMGWPQAKYAEELAAPANPQGDRLVTGLSRD